LQDANLFHGMALGDAGETVQAHQNEERSPSIATRSTRLGRPQ
jgi:hypothetical protein